MNKSNLIIILMLIFAYQANAQLQSDTSDDVWSIVAPQSKVTDIVDMRKVLVGSVKDSVVQSFLVNLSDYKSKIDSIAIVGGDAAWFDIVSGIPPYILDAKQSKNVEFRFKPTEIGIKNSQIYVYTATGNVITDIRGEGVLPTLGIENKLIDFGKVNVGGHKDTIAVVTITNTGSAILDIINTRHNRPNDSDFTTLANGGTFSLGPGETHKMNLRFTATEAGLTNGTLDFEYNGIGSPAKIMLVGEGIDDRNIKKIDSIFDLSEVCLNTHSDTLAAVLTNIGASPAKVDSTVILGPDFSQFKLLSGGGGFAIAPGETHEIQVQYTPVIEGVSTCRYAFYHAGISSPEIIAFQAEGVKCELHAGYDQDFELIKPCDEQDYIEKNVKTIINKTRAEAQIDSLVFEPDDGIFSIMDNLTYPFLMQDNEEKDLTIRFMPIDTGRVCRILKIYYNDPASPKEMEFCGFYGIHDWEVEPDTIKVYDVQEGEQKEVTYQIINAGNIPLYWNNPPIKFDDNRFVISSIDPNPTPANGSSEVTVQFRGESISFKGDYLFLNNCDMEDSITVFSLSDQIYELALKSDSLFAKPGEIIQVPIYLTIPANDLYDVSDGIYTELSFNVTLMDNITNDEIIKAESFSDNGFYLEKHLSLQLPKEVFLGEKILLDFKVGLGNSDTTAIIFNNDSTYISGFQGASLIETNNGLLALDVCHEGGDRLVTAGPRQVGIINIIPNPANESADIELYLLEEGRTSLILYNSIGEEIKTVYEGNPGSTGFFSTSINTNNLSSGIYFIILETPTQVSKRALVISK